MNKIEIALEEARKVFLTDVDSDTYEENLAEIEKWEQQVVESTEYSNWQSHDISKKVAREVRETYKDLTIQLGLRRGLTPEQIMSLQAKQDACVFMLNLLEKDVSSTLETLELSIRESIRTAM
jgi:hypothetical protein